MSTDKPITERLMNNLNRSLQTFEQDGDIDSILINFARHIIDAFEQLETRTQPKIIATDQHTAQLLNICQSMVDECDLLEDSSINLLNIRLDKALDYARVPASLPHVYDTRVPFIERPQAKWDASKTLAAHLADALDLPPLENIHNLNGQPLKARLVRHTHSDDPIYVVFAGYIMCELAPNNRRWASKLLRSNDSFCIEVPASFHFTRGQWTFRYYL